MTVESVCKLIEDVAPLSLQEKYDNSGLLIGNPENEITSVLLTLDVTEAVIAEAMSKNCNLIISHHPVIFHPLKRITGKTSVERIVIQAIKNNIAIYAAHTNMDNIINGVNGKIAEKLKLINTQVLRPANNILYKLITFVPKIQSYAVREALFEAGAGQIGNYDACSFNAEGNGTFRSNEKAQPYVGDIGKIHTEPEIRIEVIFPEFRKQKIISALIAQHPYEEPAYDIIKLENEWKNVGSGIVGNLSEPIDEIDFLHNLKQIFEVAVIKHSPLTGKKIQKIAVCGGSGNFLIRDALSANADIYISGDLHYHDFFEHENRILLADIGHFESEQYTKDVFYEIITKKIPNFAVQISEIKTNPINYL